MNLLLARLGFFSLSGSSAGIAIFTFVFFFLAPHYTQAHLLITHPLTPLTPSLQLTSAERDQLRYHLENLHNEVRYLFRHEKQDNKDMEHQEKDMQEWRLFERIPMERDIDGLAGALKQSAHEEQIHISQFRITHYSKMDKPIPQWVYTYGHTFRPSPDQLVEKIYFHLKVKGEQKKVQTWAENWPQSILRIVDLDQPTPLPVKKKGSSNEWMIQAHAYCYRQIRFPTLKPRTPQMILPKWANKNPKSFAQQEPLLWSFVEKIEKLIPKTAPLYKNRSRFWLNDARMDFFLSKMRHS